MGRLIKWFNIIIKKQKGAKRWQKVVTVMAAMITFATTYALILPAITVEKNSTEEVGGMYLEQTAEQDELLEENALEPNGVSIAADMDNAVTFSYADDDLTATAVFSTDEIIPEGTELVVSIVDPASEEYAALRGRSEGLLDKEFIYDVTSCSFYDFALVCDNVDVTPKTGMVDIQIIFRNNTNQHVNDVVYAGRFARPSEDADGFVAMAVSTAEAEAEADDTVSMNGTAVNDNSAGESGDPSAGEDELVSLNIDESSVIELSDGIITSLSLKGSDLSRSDSLVGIIAGYVDEEIKAAAAETDAEIPEYDESQDEDTPRRSGEDASANADNNVLTSPEEDSSGTSAEDERKEITDALQMKTLKASGSDYTVILTYDETSGISEEAVLTVSEIAQGSKEYNTYLEETKKAMGLKEEETLPGFAARFFDIKIMVDGKEFNPESGVSVEITYAEPLAEHSETEVNAVHFADEKAEAEMIEANTAEVQDDGKATVEFTAESFSVYGVIYTVDFHWEVDGKAYDFSIPGGGFVSLEHLVEVLGIAGSDSALDTENSAEDAESEEVAASEDAVSLNKLPVSESAKQFVADVQSVELSSPDLVWVGKADDETTVGGLKEANELACNYSAELTEEQIAEIDAQTVKEGDWALISLQPFTSEEVLTVTMKGGEVFTIRLTDAVIPSSGLVEGNRYILYAANSFGQYFALRGDGYCYRVPNNDLDSLGDEYLWRYHYVSDGWAAGTCEWFSQNDAYQIELWGVDNTAVNNQYGSYIRLDPASNGGYYFLTNNGYYGTFGLWLYNNVYSYPQTWSFRSGDVSQHNRSEIFIYEKEPLRQYTVNVNDNNYGQVRLTDSTTAWVTSGQGSIDRNGNNTHFVEARANDGYWFDHWELDGQQVEETDGISDSRIETGALNIGNEDGHILTAVFVPETSFNVEASPSGSGSVNVNSSPRTKDGYNKELISAAAGNGWWFGHWEIDGEEVPESSYTIAGDGMSSALPASSLQIGDGETLTAVFIPQITYDVTAIPETAGASITGCTVQVGESASAPSVPDNAMTRWGYNLADIIAHAGPGYVFKGWMLDDQPILGGAEIESALDGSTSTILAGTLQVSPDGQPHTVKAVFAQEYNFTVTTYPNGGGTVQDGDKAEGAGPTIYASLTKDGHNKYDISATPASGYYLSHWTLNGQPMEEGEGAAKHYLYTDGVIPEGVLDITSSDSLCAVFIKRVYSIAVHNDGHGRTQIVNETQNNKNDKTCQTNSTTNDVKQARNRITATADNGYNFAYWRVDAPHDVIVDWGNGYSVTSSTIQPNVKGDASLTAVFVSSSQRVFTVTVDDPSHGTVYGPDVSGENVSADAVGVTAYVAKTKNRGKNDYQQVNDGRPQVRTAAPGYEFLGWNLYRSDGTTLVKSYTDNDGQGNALKKWQLDNGSVNFDYDNMVLKAMFREKDPVPAFEDEAMEDLSDWAEAIAGTNYLSDKRAEVFDYDNRIYRIGMSASSQKQAIDSSVVLNFITDTSRSMYFPANISSAGNYGSQGGNSYGAKLQNWLNGKNRNNVYYIIGKQNTNATLYAIYHNGSQWVYVDASYYRPNADDGMYRDGDPVSGYNGSSGDNYEIYQAPPREEGKPWSRLDYLCMSVESAVKAIYDICPNAQIDLTTFNRSATYKGTIPNNAAAIEMLLRNIDVTGGTRQDLGLATAMEHFTNGSGKRQVAVLITDGAPNSGITTVSEANIKSWATSNAELLRGITDADGNALELYTLGLSLDNNTRDFMSTLATPGEGYVHAVYSGQETSDAIKEIVNNLLTNVSLFGTITDSVDPAFYPVDKNGEPIAAGLYAADGSTLSAAPQDNTPYYEWAVDSNGVWTITWHNQVMPWALDANTPGWKKEFFIKAKEDFLGGNKIPTNYGENNGITASGYVKSDTSVAPLKNKELVVKKFDYTPYVNVDELHMEGNDTEWTVYLGTEVDPATQIMYLLNQIPVKQVVLPGGTNDDGTYMTGAGQMYYPHDSSAVDNDDEAAPGKGTSQTLPLSHYVDFTSANIAEELQTALAQLGHSDEVTDEVTVDNIVYSEYGHAAGKFTFTVTKNVNSEAADDGAPAPHETKQVGDAVETYTLTVKYTPYTDGAQSTYEHTVAGGTSGQVTNGSGQNEVKSENTHIINVIAKGLGIIKTDKVTGDPISRRAEFKLYRTLKAGESSETSLTIDGTQVPVVEVADLVTGGQEGQDRVENLPWYKSVTEQYNGRYYLKEKAAPDGYLMLSEPVEITVTPIDPNNQDQTAGITYVIDGETHEAEERDGQMTVTVPDPPSGSLAIRKNVQTIGDVDIENMDGQYVFSVSGPADSDEQFTYYVYLDVENNEMTHYRLDKYTGLNAEAVEADRLSTAKGDVDDQAVGCLISGIETGIYVLKEQYWNLSPNSTIPPDEIYLRDIILQPATGGNTNDMFARTTSVLVTPDNPDDPETLTVTFVNEYAPDRDKFIVKKIWQDENGDSLSEPWDGSISSIEFSVTQTKNASSGSESESRRLSFGGSSKLTIQLTGMCAMVSPTEPGSADYDLHWTTGGDPWQTFISGLEKETPDGTPYTYTIEEICVRDVFGEIVTGYETTYGLSENGGSLIEEGGQAIGIESINNGATAYINNKKIVEAGLNLKKIVEASADAPLNGNLTLTNGTYSFTVTGPEGAETPSTWYVNIIAATVNNGTEASPSYTTSYTYQIGSTAAERDAMEPEAVSSGGVPITLAPGKYTITEDGWSINAPGGVMSLKDIDVSSGSNNETDLSRKEAVVYVGEGEIGSLEVAFTNFLKPYPGIRIVKIDESTRPEGTTTIYLSDAEFQILKWDGSRYQVYPNAEDSTVVTDSDGVAVFNGVEPGEYKITETVTPSGYIKPEVNDIFIKVAYNDATGLHTITRYKEAYTGDDSAARTVVAETENLLAITYVQAADAENPAAFTVGNTSGAALPNSGGPGTRLITILGAVLTAGAGLLLWRRRRTI